MKKQHELTKLMHTYSILCLLIKEDDLGGSAGCPDQAIKSIDSLGVIQQREDMRWRNGQTPQPSNKFMFSSSFSLPKVAQTSQ